MAETRDATSSGYSRGYSPRPGWGTSFETCFGDTFGGRPGPPKSDLSNFRSSSEHWHSERTNSSGRHGERICRTCHSKCLAGTGKLIMILCFSSVSAFTPANLNELKTAKTTCLNEAASGNCPNFETTHGKIGTWNISRVTSLRQSKSLVWCGFLLFACTDPFCSLSTRQQV